MDKLLNMVKQLEKEKDRKVIVAQLQKIEKALLNEYVIKVGDITIEPLLVEAYYCCNIFKDENCHQNPGQMGNFGNLYFHGTGRGGVDICLSDGDYYLSFLLKCAKVDGMVCKQVAVKDAIKEFRPKKGGSAACKLLPRKEPVKDTVVFTRRRNMEKDTMMNELLAAVSLSAISYQEVKDSMGEGKEITLVRYFLQCGDEPTEEKVRRLFGYYPKKFDQWYQNLKDELQ